MSITNTLLSNVAPTGIYLSAGPTAITTMYFCNLSASTLQVNVYLVPFLGGNNTPNWNNKVYSNLSIVSNDTYTVTTERLLLDSGDMIYADASGDANVVATISSIGI